MKYQNRTALCTLILAGSLLASGPPLPAAEDYTRLNYLLRIAEKNPEEAEPKDHIYFRSNIAYCTGASSLAVENNRAADRMTAGDFAAASEILEKAIANSALFFPFRLNLGTCYLHLENLHRAMLNYEKARAVVPEYAGTYIMMGGIYQRWYRDNDAIDCYRQALMLNKSDLNTYVVIGDLFYNRNQVQLAKKYYDQCLRINGRFNNGLLGRAKIFFREGEFYRALIVLKSIDTRREYDRAYHYYYAESAFKLRDYRSASEHYAILLENKSDPFFLTTSPALIERKLDLSKRLIQE